jgi:hypothetical protein
MSNGLRKKLPEQGSGWRVVVLICFLTLPFSARGQQPAAPSGPAGQTRPRRVAIATFTDQKITIDGVLDEPAWQTAVSPGPLLQKEPIESGPPSEVTDVLVLYDKDNLYISAYCREHGWGWSCRVHRLAHQATPP